MKRFIMNFIVGLVIIAGLIFTGSLSATPTYPDPAEIIESKPDYIVSIENKISSKSPATVTVKRFENDGYTLWLWIDSDMLPSDCDFVMILGIEDQAAEQYKFLHVWTDKTTPNSCEVGSIEYEMYKKMVIDSDPAKLRKKGGI